MSRQNEEVLRDQVDGLHRALLTAYVANGGEAPTEPTTPEDALNMVVGLLARTRRHPQPPEATDPTDPLPTVEEVLAHRKTDEGGPHVPSALYLLWHPGPDGSGVDAPEVVEVYPYGRDQDRLYMVGAHEGWHNHSPVTTDYVRRLVPISRYTGLPPGHVYDDTALDSTDGAHPAWWRGLDHAVACMDDALNQARGERDACGQLLQVVTMRADAVAREARLLMARIPDHTDVPTDGLEEALGAYNQRDLREPQQQKMALMPYRPEILSGAPWRAR